MYTVWHVNKYKITFKLVINHWTNEILQHIVVSSGLSRPGIIDTRARYQAAARRLRNTGLRRRSSAARLLRLWVRIPPEAWMFVRCEFCVLSGRGLCDGLITRPEKSYRLWRVVVCDQETSKTTRLKPATGL